MPIKIINLIRRFVYYFYGEKFFKRLDYSWANYPTRSEIEWCQTMAIVLAGIILSWIISSNHQRNQKNKTKRETWKS